MDYTNSTETLGQADTGGAHPTAGHTAAHNSHSNHQTLINIIFGIFAVILAFAALIIAWLQLRKFKYQSDEESANSPTENFELVETQ